MNSAQMEILETWKNKKAFVFKPVPREANGCFLEWLQWEGGSGCRAAVTAFVPFLLALFSSTNTLLSLDVQRGASKIVSTLEGGRVMR